MTQKPKSWIGQMLGDRYQIEALLGRGGMSSVYRATDSNLKRAVALKIIHPHLTKQPEFVQQFEQEATAVAQLRHQNIVRVYDFKREQDIYYMVLEYIPGETLAAKLAALNAANIHLPLTESVRIAINLCDAVDYAHQRRMIHRDIKPANVMINLLDEPILMDFGIAKLVGQDINNLGSEVALGSALYISPEQAQGQPVDFRTDIYALGIVLFEMLSGNPPFRGDTTQAIFKQQVEAKTPDLHLINPDIPQMLIAIVERAMAKQPERRYQTAADMVTALQGVILTLQNRQEVIGSRQMEHLTRLWLQATQAFDEKNYIGCIEKIDELTRTGADYQMEQAAQLRQEAVKQVYEQALAFFQKGQFGEAMLVITALRELAPTYPNLGHLESQVRQGMQSSTIQSDLDTLYEEAAAALEVNEYEKALHKWEAIEVKRGSLPYRDRMQIEQRAKTGICARLYNEAFLAISKQEPYETLAIWKKIQAIDPDFPDDDGVLELVQRMMDTDADIRKRDKRLLQGALIIGVLVLLFTLGWRLFNGRDEVAAIVLVATPTAVTTPATTTPKPTKTAVSPTQTSRPEATQVAAVNVPTIIPTASPMPSATATRKPTETPLATNTTAPTKTPTSTSTPANVALVLLPSSLFDTPDDKNGEELTVVDAGDEIVVLGRSEDEKWFFVDNGILAGFVFHDRLEWAGDITTLPVYTHSNGVANTPALTPIPTIVITELTFDLWQLDETAVCTTSGWEQDIFFEGHGGNGIFAYYWNDKLIKGPTNEAFIYRLISPGGAVSGFGKVESGGGKWIKKPLVVEAPNCE